MNRIKKTESIPFRGNINTGILDNEDRQVTVKSSKESTDILFNELHDALFIYVADPVNKIPGILVDVNEAACHMLGYSREELLNQQPFEFVKEYKDGFEDFDLILESLTIKNQARFEKTFIAKDGHEILTNCNAVPLDYEGNPAVIIIALDVTEQKKATNALAESEKNFRMLAENAKDMIIKLVYTPELQVEYISPASTSITGYTPEEIYNDPSLAARAVYPEDMELFQNYYISKNFDDKPVTIRWIRKDGTMKWCEHLNSPIYDEHGEITSVQVIARDITDRKNAEIALAEEVTQRRVLLEKSMDGIVVFDRSGKVLEANQRFAEMLGYTTEETTQLHVWDWDTVYSREELVDRLGSNSLPSRYFETYIRRKDGSLFPVEISNNIVVFKDKTLNFALFRDITERKKAENELEDELTRRRILVDQSRDGIVVLDHNGKVYEANQRFIKMLGYTPEEIAKLHVWDWDINFTKEQLLDVLHQDEIADDHMETRHRRKDGTEYYVEMSNNSARIAGQKLVFSICRDITDRKQAEEEQKALLEQVRDINSKLEQSNRELQDFAYIASHDLREPLRKVSSFGSLLADSLQDKLNDDEKENLEFMTDGAQRMQTMIDDLLTYSRLTTRAQEPKVVDLNTVVHDLEKLELATLLEETGGTITILKKLPAVRAEESQMRQLFQNLIGNGLKFHKPDVKPEITIDFTKNNDGMVRIKIRDNGIGIPEEYNEQIFTMFKRLHSRDTYKGNGIGLAVCKKIVKRHGGEIGVESKPDEGSTFWFTLPLLKSL